MNDLTQTAPTMSASHEETARIMQICNACRYCEGFCAVFPAMERRRLFDIGDTAFLANLCHHCGACYHACQYAPPHEFAVNVPLTLAERRTESWRDFAWPGVLAGLFDRNGLVLAMAASAGLALAIHLGIVYAFFLVLPFSKFVHAIYRFAALLADAGETRRSAV